MAKVGPELEKRIMEVIPLVARFVNTDLRLTENQYKALAKFHREAFDGAKNSTVDEINAFLIEHRENRIFHDHIEILLSPKGGENSRIICTNWPRNGFLEPCG